MFQKILLSSLFFLLLQFSLNAQDLSGFLYTEENNESIPYASVEIGQNYGVITNNEGEFTINVDGFAPKDSLRFSSMGFQSKRIALKDFQQNAKIYLRESVNELDDVFLVDKELSATEIMAKVKENLDKNHNQGLTQKTVFRRTKNTFQPKELYFKIKKATFLPKRTQKIFNKKIDSVFSASKDLKNSSYSETYFNLFQHSEDSIKVVIEKATQLKDESKSTDAEGLGKKVMKEISENLSSANTFQVKSGIFTFEDSLKVGKNSDRKRKDSIYIDEFRNSLENAIDDKNFLDAINLNFIEDYEDYAFVKENISNYQGEMVYQISFKPDRNRAKYFGNLFISAESFAVIKADYHLEEGEKAMGMNMKFLLGVKFIQDIDDGIVIFRKNEEQKYEPLYFKNETHTYFYLDRNIKFKENIEDRSKRIKFKFKMTLEGDIEEDNEYLFVNFKPTTKENVERLKERKSYPIEKIKKYDPSIWEGYPIISPNQELEEFEY